MNVAPQKSPLNDYTSDPLTSPSASDTVLSPRSPTIETLRVELPALVFKALKAGLRSFTHAYGSRVALNFLLALLSKQFSKKSPFKRQSVFMMLWQILWKEEPVRFGLFMGSFTLLWKLAFPVMQSARKVVSPLSQINVNNDVENQQNSVQERHARRLNGFIAGSLAGLALLFEQRSKVKMFGQQAAVRAVQGMYNALKFRNILSFHFGDVALFTASTAQILYAYVMHPQTLPKDFYGFMVSSARVPDFILRQIANSVGIGSVADVPALLQFVQKRYPSSWWSINFLEALPSGANPPFLGCEVVHPHAQYCIPHIVKLWLGVFKQIAVVYLPLNFVPLVLLRYKSLQKRFPQVLGRAILSSMRSSAFFAVLVTSYQAQICAQDKFFKPWHIPLLNVNMPPILYQNNRYYYYLFGVVTGLSVLLESKSRRSELAMYVAPKAIESWYRIMYKRHWIIKVPGFQTVMNSCAFGVLMAFYVTERDALSPFFYRIIHHFIDES